MKTKYHKIVVSNNAYELVKKSAKREGESMTEWLSQAIECYAKADAKQKRIVKTIAALRRLLSGSDADGEPKASPKPAPKPEPPAPVVDKFAEQRAALKRLMEQHVLACKAGDREAMERIAAEARKIKATMVS